MPKDLIWIGPDQAKSFGTGKRFDRLLGTTASRYYDEIPITSRG